MLCRNEHGSVAWTVIPPQGLHLSERDTNSKTSDAHSSAAVNASYVVLGLKKNPPTIQRDPRGTGRYRYQCRRRCEDGEPHSTALRESASRKCGAKFSEPHRCRYCMTIRMRSMRHTSSHDDASGEFSAIGRRARLLQSSDISGRELVVQEWRLVWGRICKVIRGRCCALAQTESKRRTPMDEEL